MCRSARDHGLKHIGLPSRLAQFVTNHTLDHKAPRQIWWQPKPKPQPMAAVASLSVRNVERRGWLSKKRGLKPSVCTFVLDSELNDRPQGPRIKLSLPSFRFVRTPIRSPENVSAVAVRLNCRNC